MGDNAAGPLAVGNSCSSPFYAAGFIEVNLTGRYVYLYREGAGYVDDDGIRADYAISEIDIFGTTNLVGSAIPISSYTPISAEYGVNNLI